MNIEFLFIIVNYLFTMSKRDLVLELGMPLVLSAAIAGSLFYWDIMSPPSGSLQQSISFLRILLGFTMASLALFLTKNPNLEDAKKYPTKRNLNGKPLYLYDYVVLSLSYIIIVNTLVQLCYFIYSFLPYNVAGYLGLVFKIAYILVFFHIIFATIKAITEICQTLQRKNNRKSISSN